MGAGPRGAAGGWPAGLNQPLYEFLGISHLWCLENMNRLLSNGGAKW